MASAEEHYPLYPLGRSAAEVVESSGPHHSSDCQASTYFSLIGTDKQVTAQTNAALNSKHQKNWNKLSFWNPAWNAYVFLLMGVSFSAGHHAFYSSRRQAIR
ncbi:hypothetical protein B0T25DRAFT_519074 [Lasiosphaeria hispida]|uniref:Uncharacterized protein n=1 Tax=Lasiosphaeria hispida TaxID=260671 RepID=A0AAJ0HD56_9PEZI|nr:hypothetical protein B0T25DRAFT_519074 [Lasiosphaeria hispida]